MEKFNNDFMKSIKKDKFDLELFKAIVEEILKERKIELPIDNIIYTTNNKNNIYSEYIPKSQLIKLYLNKCQNKDLIFYYIKLLESFYHELNHYEQFKFIDKWYDYYKFFPEDYDYSEEEDLEIRRIFTYIASNDVVYKKPIIYKLFHDSFPIEHEANLTSYVDSTELIFRITSGTINPQNNCLYLGKLIKDYSLGFSGLSSPALKTLKSKDAKYIYNEYLKECNLSNYDKLCLGLPVDKELYIKLRNMFIYDTIPKDFNTYIKHI